MKVTEQDIDNAIQVMKDNEVDMRDYEIYLHYMGDKMIMMTYDEYLELSQYE